MAQLEAVRLVADWLADPTGGVNALLADVPRDVGDAAPPDVESIRTSADTGWLRRGTIPRAESLTLPLLAVTAAEAQVTNPSRKTVAPGGSKIADGSVVVAVQYVERSATSDTAGVACDYTLRAVRGSLLLLAAEPSASRTRNGVQLVQLTDLRTMRYDERDDVSVSGVVLATWTTRETTP